MQNELRMNEMRRNDDAMKSECWYQKKNKKHAHNALTLKKLVFFFFEPGRIAII